MYQEFYGFSEGPFNLNPDPKFLYLSPSHDVALSSMMSWSKERKGLMVITGEVGVGKTILLHVLLKDLSEQVKTAFIFNPKMDFKSLLKNILFDLEVPIAEKEEDLDSLKLRFAQYLQERPGKNETVMIIIDEAQSLDEKVLEDLDRLLGLITPPMRLLQILLVGQPELEAKLNSGALQVIKDRIAIHAKIAPLTRTEGREYIEHRLKSVGRGISDVFTSDVVTRIWSFADGNPRVMNLLCDRALLIGYLTSSPIIDSKIAKKAMEDFSYLRPRKPGIFRPVFHQLKSHYQIIGIAFLLLGGLAFFSLFPRDSSLSILKGMVNLLPTRERPVGNVGSILPSEKQPVKIKDEIPPSEKPPAEKPEKEMKQPTSPPATKPGPAEGPKVAGKKEVPSEKRAGQPSKAKVYVIQIGAMRDLNLVKEFVEKQKRSGQQVHLAKKKIKDEEVWHIVYIGPFADQAQAARYMKEKNVKKSFPNCFIRKLS